MNIVGFKTSAADSDQISPRILLAEDNNDSRIVLKEFLLSLGFEVAEAVDGQDVLAKIDIFHPDLILMDMRMPIIDGLEVTRWLRQVVRNYDTIVIGISANSVQHLEQQFLDAGGNDFLQKPIQFEHLLEKIKQHLDLEWIYAPDHVRFESEKPLHQFVEICQHLFPQDALKPGLVFPLEAELQELLKLAEMHCITGLQEYTSTLKEKDPRYLPFIGQIEVFTERFQFKKISDYITAHLHQKEDRNDSEP